MKWTTELPSVPGWYWFLEKGEESPEIVDVCFHTEADDVIPKIGWYVWSGYGNKVDFIPLDSFDIGSWAGPIPMPTLPSIS